MSASGGCRSTAFTPGLREWHWREHVRHLLRGMDPHHPPSPLLTSIGAPQRLDRGGFNSKGTLIDWLYEQAHLPAGESWSYQVSQNDVDRRAILGQETAATTLHAAPEETVPMFQRDDGDVVVVSGETNGYWRPMGCTCGTTASIDDWR